MENPIKYDDLFDAQLLKGVQELSEELNRSRQYLLDMLKEAKEAGVKLKDVLKAPKDVVQTSTTINQMYKEYRELNGAIDQVTASLFEINEQGKSVVFTQKELNKYVKLAGEVNRSGAETYNNLSKQYSMLKILINNMTQAERENTKEGRAMVENARQIYEQMNRMQQATGKYQLQVGNYSKALNGLNIATQQVIRELPVMANGMQMFVMAISNNIPILLDNIKAFRMEQAELAKQGKATTSVMSAMLKTIFSWQTALVVVLSVLPSIIRNISKKRKETEELTKATEKNVDELSSWERILVSIAQEQSRSTTKLELLRGVIDDTTRSVKERIEAGKVLKETFTDELAGYSAEEIAAGNATSALDNLTASLREQAEARAVLNEATRVASEQLQTEAELTKIGSAFGTRKGIGKEYTMSIADLYAEYSRFGAYENVVTTGTHAVTSARTRRFTKETEDMLKEYEKLLKKSAQLQEDMDKLSARFHPSGLDGGKTIGGGRGLRDIRVPYVKLKYPKFNIDSDVNAQVRESQRWINNMLYPLHPEGTDYEIATFVADAWKEIDKILDNMDFSYKPKKTGILQELLMGEDAQEKDLRVYLRNIEKAFNLAFQYMNEMIEKRRELAQAAVDAAQKEEDSAKHAMEVEQEARANGYAHNVEFARREWEEKKRLKEEAMREEQRLAKIQQKIDEAQQMSSLLVATANIWAQYTKMSALGVALAGVATTAMWGSFAAAKIQAADLVKTKEYGEGMSEYLNYGGSHASGNDIDFGTMKDGTRRRVERGEMVAVINKRNVGKYGVDGISDIVASLNSGTFEDRYGLAFAGLTATPGGVDLSKVEEGINTLVNQGERKVYQQGGKTIEIYKNRKRIINN